MRETETTHSTTQTGIELSLIGEDGNAFSILGKAQKAMRRAKLPQEQIDQFMAEATAGDYNHLLQTTMRWFKVN